MFTKNILPRVLLVLLCGMLTASLYAQQTTATLGGIVRNSKGAPLDGATVMLKHEPTGSVSTTTTNSKGIYFINNLQPGGPYTITVSFVGFTPIEKANYNLALGSNNYDGELREEGTTLVEVTVAGRSRGARGGADVLIGQNQIRNVPSLNRSLQDITKLTPQSNNNSFAGTNFRYNNVTIDGAINNDAIGFSPSLGGQTNASGQPGSSTRTNPVSLDAIQDVQVYLAPYDVKIGNFLGGSVNAVTRSGSNEFHGSV